MSDQRDDRVSPKDRDFFEKMMKGHSRVTELRQTADQEFDVIRNYGDTVRVYLSGKYTFGELDLLRLLESHPSINCIVSASSFCGYTPDAKQEAQAREIGLFDQKEFKGAMNFREFWTYTAPS